MKITPTLLCLTVMLNAAYAADWTSYLKPIQHNCNYFEIQNTLFKKPLPKDLKKSLVKRQGRLTKEQGKIIFKLKNAKAFGKDLSQITYQQFDSNHSILTLSFANDDFMTLLPTFSFGDSINTWQVKEQKAWITFLSWQDDHTQKPIHILTNKSYPISYNDYKKAKYISEFWDNEAQKLPEYAEFTSSDAYSSEQGKNYMRYAYTTNKTGYTTYPIADADISAIMQFDATNKTISCELILIA